MKKHLNSLYVTTQGAYLGGEGETLVVRVEKKEQLRVPLHMLESVVCFGRVGVSPILMARCAKRDVSIAFLTERGRFLARVVGEPTGNVLLRRQQYRYADSPERSADVARAIVGAKIANSVGVYRRAKSDQRGEAASDIDRVVSELQSSLRALKRSPDLDTTRGIEGNAARVYFSGFNLLLAKTEPQCRMNGRNRRPPLDPVNALLSFVYTLLRHDVQSAASAAGLDPQVGFLHRDRPGRPGLASDLMEEFRPYIADRLSLSLLNRGQLSGSSFEKSASGAVSLNDDARKLVVTAYQERKAKETTHPYLNEKMTVGMLFHIQARLMARHLRGDLECYPSFFWK